MVSWAKNSSACVLSKADLEKGGRRVENKQTKKIKKDPHSRTRMSVTSSSNSLTKGSAAARSMRAATPRPSKKDPGEKMKVGDSRKGGLTTAHLRDQAFENSQSPLENLGAPDLRGEEDPLPEHGKYFPLVILHNPGARLNNQHGESLQGHCSQGGHVLQ